MSEYTEQQIRELSGRELRVAVHRLVLGDDMYAYVPDFRIGYRPEPLEMPLDWCVPELMELDWKLERLDKHWCVTVPDETAIPLPGLDRAVAVGWSDSLDDPATAIQRAACIVALREGGD